MGTEPAVIAAGLGLIGLVAGFALRELTGENSSNRRRGDADASKAYSEAASNTARLMVDLQDKVEALERRDKAKEHQIEALLGRIGILEAERAEWLKEREEFINRIHVMEIKISDNKRKIEAHR